MKFYVKYICHRGVVYSLPRSRQFRFFPLQKEGIWPCAKKHRASVSSRTRLSLDRSRHADMNNSSIAKWSGLPELRTEEQHPTHSSGPCSQVTVSGKTYATAPY